MRIGRKIFLFLAVTAVLLFIGLHVFVNMKGKDLLIADLREKFGRDVIIGGLFTSFPADVHIEYIEVKGLFSASNVIAGRCMYDVFRKSLSLSTLKIIRPSIIVERAAVNPSSPANPAAGTKLLEEGNSRNKIFSKADISNLSKQAASLPNAFLSSGLFVRKVMITDGTFTFVDKNTGTDKEITIVVKDINAKIDNLNLASFGSPITSFELTADIPWNASKEKGTIALDGWVNIFKKDIQATIIIKDIDGIYLYPYYASWVNLEKSRIEKAKLSFTSNVHGLNNDVAADCHLELTDIAFKPPEPEKPQEKEHKIALHIMDLFKSMDQGVVVLDFTIKTKLDKPRFSFSDIKMVFRNKLLKAKEGSGGIKPEAVVQIPGKIIEGTVKSVTDVTKALISGGASVGKELKSAVEGAFRKETPVQEAATPVNQEAKPQTQPETQPSQPPPQPSQPQTQQPQPQQQTGLQAPVQAAAPQVAQPQTQEQPQQSVQEQQNKQ